MNELDHLKIADPYKSYCQSRILICETYLVKYVYIIYDMILHIMPFSLCKILLRGNDCQF
jgi:hypothetical protein